MLIFPKVLASLALAATACGGSSSAGSGGERPTPSVTPSAAVTTAYGGTAQLPYKTGKAGYLWIEVEEVRTPTGTKVTVTYERNINCGHDPISKDQSTFNCTTAWTETKALPSGAFVYDPMLATATLTHTLRGKRISVAWKAAGETRRLTNENGNLLTEMREQRARVTWGADSYTNPAKSKTPDTLYRRVTAATPEP